MLQAKDWESYSSKQHWWEQAFRSCYCKSKKEKGVYWCFLSFFFLYLQSQVRSSCGFRVSWIQLRRLTQKKTPATSLRGLALGLCSFWIWSTLFFIWKCTNKKREREPVHALNCEPISQSVSCPSLWWEWFMFSGLRLHHPSAGHCLQNATCHQTAGDDFIWANRA